MKIPTKTSKLPRVGLIKDWRKAWRMYSVQAMAIAAIMLQFVDAWNSLPPEFLALLPQEYVVPVAKWVIIIGAILRLVQQFAPEEDNAKDRP